MCPPALGCASTLGRPRAGRPPCAGTALSASQGERGEQCQQAAAVLLRVFGRLPRGASRAFARDLNAVTKPFDVVNYLWGQSVAPGRWATPDGHGHQPHGRLAAPPSRCRAGGRPAARRALPHQLGSVLHGPHDIADLYRYPTQDFDFHLRQLTPTVADELDRPPTPGRPTAGAPPSPIFSRRSGSGYTGSSNLLVPTSTRVVSRPTGLQNTPSRA